MTREEAKERVNYIDYIETTENDWIIDSGVKQLLDKVYDDFESMVCKNCKYWTDSNNNMCIKFSMYADKNYGCNKFERKAND